MITRNRATAALMVVAFAAVAVLTARLSGQERGGPPHLDVVVGDGLPATLYVPGEAPDPDSRPLPPPPPEGRRPPVAVVAHGFAADRAIMSTLARSLTAHGYAVLTLDFRGHGDHRAGFRSGELRSDLAAAVDWLETSPYVDPERVVTVGHSMGASAVLDFAAVDARPVAVVPISGGWRIDGPERPANVLFVVAEDDPGRIHESQELLARRLAGRSVEVGAPAGDVDAGTGVARIEISDTDHLTVLFADATVNGIVGWLDDVTGLDRTGALRGRVDDRLGTVGLLLIPLGVLVAGLGLLAGRMAPAHGAVAARPALAGLVVLAVAMLGAAPLFALVSPGGFLQSAAGDVVAGHAAVAGGAVLVARALRRRGAMAAVPEGWLAADRELGAEPWRAVGAATLAAAGFYLLLAPLGVVFHDLVPTPERLAAAAVTAVLLLPLFVAFEALVRRGPTLTATLYAVAGRVVILLALAAAVRMGMFPGVVSLILPVLAGLFVLFEVAATAMYSQGRNVVLIALTEATVLGWVTAVTMPLG